MPQKNKAPTPKRWSQWVARCLRGDILQWILVSRGKVVANYNDPKLTTTISTRYVRTATSGVVNEDVYGDEKKEMRGERERVGNTYHAITQVDSVPK